MPLGCVASLPQRLRRQSLRCLSRGSPRFWYFPLSRVLVVAFSGFIVVSQNTNSIRYQRQTIFESVAATGQWLRHLPYYQLDLQPVLEPKAFAEQRCRLRPLTDRILWRCWQCSQQPPRSTRHFKGQSGNCTAGKDRQGHRPDRCRPYDGGQQGVIGVSRA